MNPYMLGLYIALCFILAIAGRHTRLGPIGIFLLSLVFTPIIVGMILTAIRPMPRQEAHTHSKSQPKTQR